MPLEPVIAQRRRLGEVLVEQEVLTEKALETALLAQLNAPAGTQRERLGTTILRLGLATEAQIATALATALNLAMVDFGRTPVNSGIARLLPRAVAERHECLVLALDGDRITVATTDPTNVVATDDIRVHTGATEIVLRVSTATQLRENLARAWSLTTDSSDLIPDSAPVELEEIEDGSGSSVDAAPVVRLVNAVLGDAVRSRASDVHIEPQQSELRVRYRVDGVLRQVMTVPRGLAAAVVSRIKIMSGLDIAERRRPQDGRSRIQTDGTMVDVRISTLPTMHGEKVVLRLLARADDIPGLDRCGLSPEQLLVMRGALSSPQGLVIICGPTGSGKTSTLYAALGEISDIEHNVVTLEDPVELQLPGISQVQVHEASGLTFARGLRSVLRQDPDVVLVGEARDTETAELALQASLTGHLVLTTLHTNDAVSAVTRLVEMGADAFLLASCLTLVVAQRLVRVPCERCVEPYVPVPGVLHPLGLTIDDLAGATARHGAGCAECGQTGYRGRIGIFEMLPITEALRTVLHESPTEAAVGAAARESGVRTLRSAAIARAMEGKTTFEEALRVTHADADVGLRCPSCARAVGLDMVACPWCSADLESGRCAGCERMLQPEWHLCPWCRTVPGETPAKYLVAAPAPIVYAQPVTAAPPQPTAAVAPPVAAVAPQPAVTAPAQRSVVESAPLSVPALPRPIVTAATPHSTPEPARPIPTPRAVAVPVQPSVVVPVPRSAVQAPEPRPAQPSVAEPAQPTPPPAEAAPAEAAKPKVVAATKASVVEPAEPIPAGGAEPSAVEAALTDSADWGASVLAEWRAAAPGEWDMFVPAQPATAIPTPRDPTTAAQTTAGPVPEPAATANPADPPRPAEPPKIVAPPKTAVATKTVVPTKRSAVARAKKKAAAEPATAGSADTIAAESPDNPAAVPEQRGKAAPTKNRATSSAKKSATAPNK